MKIMIFSPATLRPVGVASLLFLLLAHAFVDAAPPLEEKWKASVPGEGAQFGSAIAISGDRIAVGAFAAGENGEGSVHILNRETGEILEVLESPNGEEEGLFGYSLVWAGNKLLVGAPLEDGDGMDDGAVYVFDFIKDEVSTISSPSDEDGQAFGVSLAAEDGMALIGSLFEKGEGEKRGAAYVYDLDSMHFIQRLSASDTADNDEFGISVSLSNGVAAVGAWKKAHPDGANMSGAVYLFKANSGVELRKIENPNPQDRDGFFGNFGCSVLLHESELIVGAKAEEHSVQGPDDFQVGAAYSFDATTGEQLHRFASPRSTGDAYFGSSLARDGNLLVIGAPEDASNSDNNGAAHLFDLTTGREIQQILASDLMQDDEFGFAVAISGKEVYAGARFEGEDPARGSGAVYRYLFGHQPDLLIGESRRNLRGNDRYNDSGSGQVARIRSRGNLRFSIQAQNDGSLPDRIRLNSRRNSAKFRYRITKAGGGNVSGAMARGNYRSAKLYPGDRENFRVVVRPRSRSRATLRENCVIRSVSLQDNMKSDTVKALLLKRS